MRGLACDAPLDLVVGALGDVVVAVVVEELLLLMRLILSPRALYSSLLCFERIFPEVFLTSPLALVYLE